MSFFSELKRRNVFRVGAAYVVGTWLVLQVIDVVAPMLALPDSLGKTILLVLAIGFPIALVLAWVYELTPEGIVPESEVDRSQSVTNGTGRKLDFVIIGVLSAGLIFFALDKFVWNNSSSPDKAAGWSIAVLPFVNSSSDPDHDYLSDGLAEEMIGLLVQIDELRVTSRATAFTYKGKAYRTSDIGRELGVNHVLEGSVRRAGNRVRITANLVETAEDRTVWSETWERTLDDVFAIQDEIAESVVEVMKVRLAGAVPHSERTSPESYALYLQAGQLLNHRNAQGALVAEDLLVRAVEIDSGYVSAWLRLADTYLMGGAVGAWHPQESFPDARDAASEALRLDPENIEAMLKLASLSVGYDYDYLAAAAYIERARTIDPDHDRISLLDAYIASTTGHYDVAIAAREKAVAADPANTNLQYLLGQLYFMARRYDDAKASLRKAIELAPDSAGSHFYLGAILLLEGDLEAADREIEQENRDGYKAMGRALLLHRRGHQEQAAAALQALIDLGYRWTYQIAAVYAYRSEPDEAFLWLERAIGRRDTSLHLITGDPFMDNIRDDPRFDVVLERLGRKPLESTISDE